MTTKQSKTESLEKNPLNFTWKEEHMSITGKDCKKKKTPENLVLVEMKNAML